MTTSGAIDLPLQTFGSFCPELPPASLPPGLSPNCQDVEFIRGGVKTRPGLFQQFQLPGNPTVNYMKTYITPSEVLRLLALDSLGNVYKETPMGTLNTVIGTVVPGSFGKSTTCFGREYIAFGDGINGIDIPRQYDDTNFDRVSQVGPGAAPSAIDQVLTANITASPGGLVFQTATIANSPNGLIEVGNVVTVTLTASTLPLGIRVGDLIQITGAGVAAYNGTWAIASIAAGAGSFTFVHTLSGLAASGGGTVNTGIVQVTVTAAFAGFVTGQNIVIAGAGVAGYNATWQVRVGILAGINVLIAVPSAWTLGNSGNGTITAAGNISAGVHQLSVVFVTRQGYITAPAPPSKWTAAGGLAVTVGGIPIGPPNVVARILIFTATGGANFFYTGPQSPLGIGNMIINDNTTTTVTVDFTDAVLLSGINADALFNLIELGDCAGVIDYADRMFWWGERNKLNNLVNPTFDGGFGAGFPLGWLLDNVSGAGGGSALAAGLPAYWGDAYAITGDGVTAIRGKISQSVFQDFRGVSILLPNTSYSIRVRLARNNVLVAGTVHINIAGFPANGINVAAGALTTSYQEFTAVLLPAQIAIASTLTVLVFADGTPTNLGVFLIDCIEIFPTLQPDNLTQIRASYNVGANTNLGPESFDGVTGVISPQPFDGQGVRCMFKLREFLYIVKERSLYVTQDDGINEPANWSIHQVSGSVGTPSVNGVAIGEDWAIIANRNGLYLFTGGEPTKISQEIQSNQTDIPLKFYWDNVDWSVGQFLWTLVDTLNRRIFVSVPVKTLGGDGSTAPGIFYLDYRPMNDGSDIIASTPIHTSYAGKVINYEHSRKWSPWNVTTNCGAVIERGDGTGQVFFGSGLHNGQIWSLSETQLYDLIGVTQTAINGFYVPYGFPSHDEEEGLQLGSHKKDYTYLTAYVTGAGLCNVLFMPENPAATQQQLTTWLLGTATTRDHEQTLGGNITAERGFFLFGTNAVGSFFKMQKFVPSLKPGVIPLRGLS
jgi:hypothetical protein